MDNMNKTILFHVTEAHINEGIWDCWACPVALALAEVLHCPVNVTGNRIKIFGNDFPAARCVAKDLQIISSPSNVVDFVLAYDSHEKVEPFSFELTVQVHSL